MLKKVLLNILIITLLASCVSNRVQKEPEKEELHGFRYEVPTFLEESPDTAYSFRYDNLLLEKGKKYYDSNILIAIRHSVNYDSYTLARFVEIDQSNLNSEVRVNYDKFDWSPAGFNEKNIDHISYQFYYKYGKDLIFQRSVYLEHNNVFYVVSLSSKSKNHITDNINDIFWDSIRID